MSDEDTPRPNRTIFQPSPLQQRRNLAGGTSLGDAPPTPSRPAAPGFVPPDDIPRPPIEAEPRNALLARVAPLLALLASLKSGRASVPLPELHRRCVSELTALQSEFASRLSPDHLRRALYALAATGDDVVQNLPLPEAEIGGWTQRSLCATFFQEAIGGDRFWRLLDEMIARPAEFQNLLELYHACMAAGMEGRYRVESNGRHEHQALMQRVYQALDRSPLPRDELAPHWRGIQAPASKVGLWEPLAMAAAIAVAVLLIANLSFRGVLAVTGQPARVALLKLNPGQVSLADRDSAAPVQGPDKLSQCLATEQPADLTVTPTPVGDRIVTKVPAFEPDSDQINPAEKDLFGKIATAINSCASGDVHVEGYTDSTQPRGITFPTNMILSQARADRVRELLQSSLSDPARKVTSEGKGEENPLALNDTPAGQALNRRVEIVVDQARQ